MTEAAQYDEYSPEPVLRNPRRLIRAMRRDLAASRELAWRLATRDIKARYRQSFFGVLWAFLPPIVTALIFIVLRNNGVTQILDPASVLIGAVLWGVFTESLNAPLRTLTASKAMLAKINFPHEALILSAMIVSMFDLAVRSVILIAAMVYFNIQPTSGILVAPGAIFMLVLCGFAIGMFLLPIGALYTDVAAALPVVTGLWFFMTPVVYEMPSTPPYSFLMNFNPPATLIVAARDWLTMGSVENLAPFLIVSSVVVLSLGFTWLLYRVSLPILIERMSA